MIDASLLQWLRYSLALANVAIPDPNRQVHSSWCSFQIHSTSSASECMKWTILAGQYYDSRRRSPELYVTWRQKLGYISTIPVLRPEYTHTRSWKNLFWSHCVWRKMCVCIAASMQIHIVLCPVMRERESERGLENMRWHSNSRDENKIPPRPNSW